jgi:hypothetical protein
MYKDITLSNISQHGIVIEQDYENGSPTGTPTTGVPITNLTLSNVKGSVLSSAMNIYVLCGDGSCSNWSWREDINFVQKRAEWYLTRLDRSTRSTDGYEESLAFKGVTYLRRICKSGFKLWGWE